MNRRFWQKIEDNTRADDRRQEEQKRTGESNSVEEMPPLLVVLKHDLGKLPKGIVLLFPHQVAVNLILHRLATPVADHAASIDLEITDDQIMHAGLPPELIPLEAVLETALEAA